jgi:tetratricopeptide (TPR) repeat protein/predicted aspartyl protease
LALTVSTVARTNRRSHGSWRCYAAIVAAAAGVATVHDAAAKCSVARLLELPVTMQGLRPTVPVKLNGRDAWFIADSGAFYSSLSPATAHDFGLPTHADPRIRTIRVVGGDIDVRVTSVAEFGLGGATIRKIEFLVGGSELGNGAAGLIGQNILRIGDVEYDLANGVIRLMKVDDCDKVTLAYWTKEGQAYSIMPIEGSSPRFPHTRATALLNGVKINVIFDTGAATSVLSRRAAERAGVKLDGEGVVFAGFGAGFGEREIKSWISPFTSLKLGDEEIKNTRIRIGELDGIADMLVGADFFISHRVFVSNRSHRMFFTYNGGPVFNLAQAPTTAGTTTDASGEATASADDSEPADAAAYSRRGMALRARREYARAIDDLTKACELAPTEATYFQQRGMAYWYNRQPILAMGDFDQALRLRPDDPETLVSRARLRQGAGDKHGALEDLAAADRLLPKDAQLRLGIGELHVDGDRFIEAIEQLNQWVDTHPHDGQLANALNSRCWARAMWGQELDNALDDCNEAVRRNREGAAYLDSRGMVFLRMGNYAKAIADYDAALKLSPGLPWSRYGRGLAKLKLGQKEDGDADLSAALKVAPELEKTARAHGLQP